MGSFWAKRDGDGNELPVTEHLLDVAGCLSALIRAPGYRRALEHAAGRELNDIDLDRLGVIGALHDVGKINADFQLGKGGHLPHGQAVMLSKDFPFRQALLSFGSRNAIRQALCASVSHHGEIVKEDLTRWSETARMIRGQNNTYDFTAALLNELRAIYPLAFQEGPGLPENPEFWHLFAGLLTIADQIGSGTRNFPVLRPDGFMRNPELAISEAGLDATGMFPVANLSVPDIFGWPESAAPTEVQDMMGKVPVEDRLILVESETGSGKTEAALLRFRKLAEAGAVQGMYFAIPTRSSAVQIQRRVNQAVSRMWNREATLAVPGYLTSGDELGQKTGPFDVVWGEQGRIVPSRWSAEAPRKYLCSPVAVGTIDQALFSVLRRKWAHMRGAALSRSLLVVDEVHASDFYMSELLIRLLKTHLSFGGHAMLMSATLTTQRRHQIFEQCGAEDTAAQPIGYPAVTVLRGKKQVSQVLRPTGSGKSVRMQLQPWMCNVKMLAKNCADEFHRGGRVLVIRNSVRGAITLYNTMRTLHPEVRMLEVNGRPVIHHSRYSADDRKAIDAAVENALGKGSTDPVVVIGTQTLEQSLDIDADLLLTDICPVDVLLQRVGRLHRHVRNARPDHFKAPKCIVLHSPNASEKDLRSWGQIGRDRAYPDPLVVSETALMIEETETWTIPLMNRKLVDRGAREDLAESAEGTRRTEREGKQRYAAKMAALDWTQPIYDAEPFGPENASRLGEPAISIRMRNCPRSPLGTGPVRELSIPAWMLDAGGLDLKDPPDAHAEPAREGFTFRLAGNAYLYGLDGLQQTHAKLS